MRVSYISQRNAFKDGGNGILYQIVFMFVFESILRAFWTGRRTRGHTSISMVERSWRKAIWPDVTEPIEYCHTQLDLRKSGIFPGKADWFLICHYHSDCSRSTFTRDVYARQALRSTGRFVFVKLLKYDPCLKSLKFVFSSLMAIGLFLFFVWVYDPSHLSKQTYGILPTKVTFA